MSFQQRIILEQVTNSKVTTRCGREDPIINLVARRPTFIKTTPPSSHFNKSCKFQLLQTGLKANWHGPLINFLDDCHQICLLWQIPFHNTSKPYMIYVIFSPHTQTLDQISSTQNAHLFHQHIYFPTKYDLKKVKTKISPYDRICLHSTACGACGAWVTHLLCFSITRLTQWVSEWVGDKVCLELLKKVAFSPKSYLFYIFWGLCQMWNKYKIKWGFNPWFWRGWGF